MKREAIIFLFLSICVFYSSILLPMNEGQLQANIIPDDAIRLRILANSNSDQDQEVKRQIRDTVRAEISSWVEQYRSVEQAREVIKEHLPDIRKLVKKELRQAGLNIPYSVKLGSVAFPTKLYGSFIYPAGEYETVLISLGDGLGANWWCVLFPPLCFLDIDSGEAVKEEEEYAEDLEADKDISLTGNDSEEHDIEVTFFIVEWFSNLWKKLKGFF